MQTPVSIFLIDDHPIVRNGIRSLIESMGPYKVIRQFDNGQDLIDAIPFDEAPQLMILDLAMPVMDGKETVKQLRALNVNIPVLILTLETDEQTIIELFRMGIRGYLPKSSTAEILKKAIDDVIHTGYYHNEILIKALTANTEDKAPQQPLVHATEREAEFLRLVCDEQEYTYEQIAHMMGISRRTVDGHRESLFEKFNIKSKTGLVLFAIKSGIYKVEQAKTQR
ncbi:MAG: response regulator transcription factor [Sphingobacteriales bacterium]|nr:MAG: response regulator transcription factor [Sphingobacteriales bacterium]